MKKYNYPQLIYIFMPKIHHVLSQYPPPLREYINGKQYKRYN